MDTVGKHVQQFMKKTDIQKLIQQQQKELLQHAKVRTFIANHKADVTEEMFQRSISNVSEFVEQQSNCDHCPGLAACKNMVKGYEPALVIQGKMLDVTYQHCPLKIKEDAEKEVRQLISCVHLPKDIKEAKFEDVALDDLQRVKAIQQAKQFAEECATSLEVKGLFFYGSFGVGKTFLLGCIANELAQKGVRTSIVYVPEFVREMKASINNDSFSDKISVIQRVPVLMLDDIGAESMSSWVRDDILGPIFQYRMQEKLPTCFSSNFSHEELLHHFSFTQRGEEERVKGARIMERIKFLATPVEMRGNNRR
ncbi:MAG: primosomal protein DnaI [Bacilli bacterium]